MDITPWAAKTNDITFRYDDIIKTFGVTPINQELIQQFETVTNSKAHKWLPSGYEYFAITKNT